MSKFMGIVIGGLEIAGGIVMEATGFLAPLGGYLIGAGIGTVMGGIGTLLSQQGGGLGTASRNPVMPWNVVYGRAKVGGTIVYISSFGDDNKYLDLVFVLAAHPCQSIDALLFDGQRVPLNPTSHCSFSPTQLTVSISSIVRAYGVVTVHLSSPISDLQVGDKLTVQDVSGTTSGDRSLNGEITAYEVVSPTQFTYLSGGLDVSLGATGQVVTRWPDYRAKVYCEFADGTQTTAFHGMIFGTPYDGDMGSPIVPPFPPGNPWTDQHVLQGKACAFVRLHYNDEVFSSGLPQIAFLLHGKNDIYDPRTSPASGAYTENAALCIADYLANVPFGFKATYGDEIPIAPLIHAANICDEAITLSSGATEPRYACNGNFQLKSSRGEILQNMLTACGGRITYSGGQFIIHPAAWNGVALELGGKKPSSVVFNITTSHTYGTNVHAIGTITRNLDLDPSLGLWVQTDGFVYDNTQWATRTDSETIPYDPATGLVTFSGGGGFGGPSRTSTLREIVVTVYNSDTLFQDDVAGSGDKMQVYDCWLDLTYPDGSTAVMRPTAWSRVAATTGAVTDPEKAVDDDSATFATVERWHTSSLGAGPGLQITGFALVGAGGGPVPPDLSAPGIEGSREILSLAAGPFVWKSKLPIRELYNGCKGMFISPANGWQNSDFPPYAQDADHGYSGPSGSEGDQNLADDGGDRRWLEIQLPFTISPFCAQRLAKIELMRKRQQGMGTFSFNMSLYKTTALDIIALTLPILGWNGKLLELSAHRLVFNRIEGGPTLGCELDLQETDPSVYDWSVTEQLAQQGVGSGVLPSTSNTGTPSSVTAISNSSTAVTGADGISRSRILVTWPLSNDAFVTQGGHVEIHYQQTSSPAGPWVSAPSVGGTDTQTYISSVTDGATYVVEVRYVNAAGSPGQWMAAPPVTVGGANTVLPPSHLGSGGASSGNTLVWNGSAWVPGAALELQTNGVDNTLQTKLNLKSGANITLTADALGGVTIQGSGTGSGAIRTVSANYTVVAADYTVVAITPAITITLPVSPALGQIAIVKNGNGTAGQTITVTAGGSIPIDGPGSVILDAAASIEVQWDGSQWRIVASFGVIGSTASSGATIRGTGILAISASTFTVPFPAGTVAGDFAVVFLGIAYGVTTPPAGWTLVEGTGGPIGWITQHYTKTLTSGDISAGSATWVLAGTFNAVFSIVTFVGATGGLRDVPPKADHNQGTPHSITTASAAAPGDMAIYFGSVRATATCTVSRGVSQQAANGIANGSGCIYAESITSAGTVTATFTYSSDPSNYDGQSIVLVKA